MSQLFKCKSFLWSLFEYNGFTLSTISVLPSNSDVGKFYKIN